MKGLFFHGNRNLQYAELDRPEPGEREIRLCITDAGLSQATVAEFIEGPFIGNAEPHPRTNIALPIIPCQEFGGVIDAVGPGGDESLIGKTGAVLPSLPCGDCEKCQAGTDNLCLSLAYRGLVGAHGGFVEQIVIPELDFFETAPNIPPNMVEPLLVAVHAIDQLNSKGGLNTSNESVIILGAGCIGICLATILRDAYGLQVLLTDPLPNRLECASSLGFNTIAHSELTNKDNSFSIVVDAAGKDLTIDQQPLDLALDICAAGGRILAIGTYFITLELLPARFLFQEITVLPSFAYSSSDVEALSKIQYKLTTDLNVLLMEIPFDDIVEKGYYLAELDRNAFTRITTSPFQSQKSKIAA